MTAGNAAQSLMIKVVHRSPRSRMPTNRRELDGPYRKNPSNASEGRRNGRGSDV